MLIILAFKYSTVIAAIVSGRLDKLSSIYSKTKAGRPTSSSICFDASVDALPNKSY